MALFDQDRILALDIGASRVVLAEFVAAKSGVPQLVSYGIEQLGIDPDTETDPSAYIVAAIRDIMREQAIKPAPVLMSISGQAVFPRYVKLPPVTRDKVMQIISYEAEQNVPFPINEVVWDYQLIEGGDGADLNVMLVAVKTDRVSSLTDCVMAAGLEPEIVDVAPLALYNIVRYSYPDLSGCTMVLDIGARSSNVIFVEENRIFTRSIPAAGNTITQEVMKEFELSFADADKLKKAHAFVAFGGVYAGPDNDVADRISKIVRTVITRLHAEVNRSINFYRSQQGGNPPSVVLLTGGSATIPHMDTFFREKLKAQVEYLNPFKNVTVDTGIEADRVSRDVFVLGEVTGLALRRSLMCPVEINLMPSHIVSRKAFRKRIPFFAVAAVCLVLVMLSWWGYLFRMQTSLKEQMEKTEEESVALRTLWGQLSEVEKAEAAVDEKVKSLVDLAELRTRWLEILNTIHANMLDGMWITSLTPVVENGTIKTIMISGNGFTDKIVVGTYVEQFRDKLIASPYFTEETVITRMPAVRPDDYQMEFSLRLALREPIEVGAAAVDSRR